MLEGNQEKIPNLGVLAQSLHVQASLQLAMGQTDSALNTWQKAADTYTKIKDNSGVVRSQINQAQALRIQRTIRNS